MSEPKESVDPQMAEWANGIFSTIVSFVKFLETKTTSPEAREYVAAYLERLSQGLRSNDQERGTDD